MAEYEVVIPLCILTVVVIVINLVCIIVISSTPWLRRPSNVAIASLLGAHLAQGAIVIPSYAVKRYGLSNVEHQGIACDVFRFSYMLLNYANCLTLLIISVDRFLSIKFPLNYSSYVTKSRILKCVAMAWLYVLILCFLPFINDKGANSEGCTYRITKQWSVGMLLGNTVLPCIIMSVIYVYIFNTARHAARRKMHFARSRDEITSRKKSITITRRSLREIVAAKMSLLIVLVFFLCWGPSTVYYLMRSLCASCFNEAFNNSKAESIWNFVMKLLTFLDALAAPIIYCWQNRGFQSRLRRLWKSKVSIIYIRCRPVDHGRYRSRTTTSVCVDQETSRARTSSA